MEATDRESREGTDLQRSHDVTDLLNDHALQPVPPDQRQSLFQLTIVQIGWNISVNSFLVGGVVGAGVPFWTGVLAILLGNLVLVSVSTLVGLAGCRTGLTSYLISRVVFGVKGSVLVSVMLGIIAMGFIGVLMDTWGQAVNQLIPAIPGWAFVLAFAVAITSTSIFGFKGLARYSAIAVPIEVAIALFALVKIGSLGDGFGAVFEHQPAAPIGFGVAVGAVIATWITGAALVSDVTRYAPRSRDVLISNFAGFVVGAGVFETIAMISAMKMDQSNFVLVMSGLGLLAPAAVMLFLALWALNTQIAQLGEVVAAHFGRHPDAEIYASLPGLGVILTARVLGEFGDDPARCADAKARKSYAGTAPITRASGTKRVVLARYARNRRLGDALQQWAFCALRGSPRTRLLPPAARPQHRPPGRPTPTRKPARRHPPRVHQDPDALRRTHRLVTHPRRRRLTPPQPGMSAAVRMAATVQAAADAATADTGLAAACVARAVTDAAVHVASIVAASDLFLERKAATGAEALYDVTLEAARHVVKRNCVWSAKCHPCGEPAPDAGERRSESRRRPRQSPSWSETRLQRFTVLSGAPFARMPNQALLSFRRVFPADGEVGTTVLPAGSDQGVRRLRRPALEGQDRGIDHVAVPELDRTAQRVVGVPRGGAFEHRTQERNQGVAVLPGR